MLSPVEKSDIIRHLGYPARAISRTGQGSPSQLRDYAINQILYELDSRLEELDVVDEARLTGACIGAVAIVGQDPQVGDTVSVQVSSDDLTSLRTLMATAAQGDSKFNLAAKLTALAAQDGPMVAAGFQPGGPFQGDAVFDKNLNVQFELKAQNAFSLTVSFSGSTAATVTYQGNHVEPSAPVAKVAGVETIKWGFLPILNWLHSAIGSVTQNSAVAKAGEYVRGRELQERIRLKQIWRNDLAAFLGVPLSDSDSGGFVL